MLSITIDDKLKFAKHTDILCKNIERQINVLYRLSDMFDMNERNVIHDSFILANCNYCSLVWHFCDTSSARKIEKNQERALRLLLNDKTSSYAVLLEKTLHVRSIKSIACIVFKSSNYLNSKFMKEMFKKKDDLYDLINHIFYINQYLRK